MMTGMIVLCIQVLTRRALLRLALKRRFHPLILANRLRASLIENNNCRQLTPHVLSSLKGAKEAFLSVRE
jgi:hypothetical protein